MRYLEALFAKVVQTIKDRPPEVEVWDNDGSCHSHRVTYHRDYNSHQEYARIKLLLPKIQDNPAYAELEDGTFGKLEAIRVYIPKGSESDTPW